MKKEKLYEAIGDIKEEYINDAHMATTKKSRPVWVKWGAMAACFAVIAVLGISMMQNNSIARLLRAVDTKFIWERGKRDKPCNPSYFRKKFKEELEGIEGVRVLTPHSCRHTYVSQMQALGVDLATIQSLVGHADVDMTKHYLHVQDPVRLGAIAKFDEAFFEKNHQEHPNIIEFYKSS